MKTKEERKSAFNIFLSYVATDRAYAQRLDSLITQRPNIRIFTTESLSAGEEWQVKLKDALSKCDVFLVILSPNSIDSKWVLHELGAAWAIGKPIIPIITHPELFSKIPVSLQEIESVEVKDLDKPEILNKILDRFEILKKTTALCR